jgi:hypothetical protein
MRSNVSCRSWVSAALGGLSVTPRAGVRVDQQPDGFTFPHSFSLFSYCGRYPRASQILKRDDKESSRESDKEREDLKHVP